LDLIVGDENAATGTTSLLELLHPPLEIPRPAFHNDRLKVDSQGLHLEYVVDHLPLSEAQHPGRHPIADSSNFEDVCSGAETSLAESSDAIGGGTQMCPDQVNVRAAHGDARLLVHDLPTDPRGGGSGMGLRLRLGRHA